VLDLDFHCVDKFCGKFNIDGNSHFEDDLFALDEKDGILYTQHKST